MLIFKITYNALGYASYIVTVSGRFLLRSKAPSRGFGFVLDVFCATFNMQNYARFLGKRIARFQNGGHNTLDNRCSLF